MSRSIEEEKRRTQKDWHSQKEVPMIAGGLDDAVLIHCKTLDLLGKLLKLYSLKDCFAEASLLLSPYHKLATYKVSDILLPQLL